MSPIVYALLNTDLCEHNRDTVYTIRQGGIRQGGIRQGILSTVHDLRVNQLLFFSHLVHGDEMAASCSFVPRL